MKTATLHIANDGTQFKVKANAKRWDKLLSLREAVDNLGEQGKSLSFHLFLTMNKMSMAKWPAWQQEWAVFGHKHEVTTPDKCIKEIYKKAKILVTEFKDPSSLPRL